MGLAVIVPVLGRPHRVAPLIADIAAATSIPHRVLFVADRGDHAELAALAKAGAQHIVVAADACYAKKINAGFAATDEPLVFSAADDLHFHPGWFFAAAAELHDGIEVVGTNDLGNQRTIVGDHSTHTLFTRHYIDTVGGTVDGGPGVVLHPSYPHDWCDDEFVGTAKSRGVYAHAVDSHVEHLHYLWGKGTDDDTYRKGRAGTRVGRRIFRQRRPLWEGR